MRPRPPTFFLPACHLLVVSLIVPLACSGSSRNVEPPKPAAKPPPSPCEVADGLRAKVKPFLDEGRLDRTVRLIEKADRLCPASANNTWAALVLTLADLGRYEEASKVAAQIEAAADAPADAKAAAVSARDTCDKLDKVFADADAEEAKAEMRRLTREAMDADTDGETRLAKEKYLAAWETWQPNEQALVGAGLAAKKLGRHAEAQRLFDRAIVDAEKVQGKPLTLDVPNGFSGGINDVAWSRDGQQFAVAHGDQLVERGEISIFDRMWRETFRLQGHAGKVNAVAFAPDGKTLASGSQDKTVILWNVATGKELRKLKGHTSYVDSVAYSPDGKTLASGAWDKTIKLWDVATGKPLRTLEGLAKYVNFVAYSPDGKTITSGADDKTVTLWDVATGKTLRMLGGHAPQPVPETLGE